MTGLHGGQAKSEQIQPWDIDMQYMHLTQAATEPVLVVLMSCCVLLVT